MKKSSISKGVYKQICDFMGEDLDTPVCKEVAEHLENCPHCRVYLDTIKRTVSICQEKEKGEQLPAEIKSRLLKVLNIGHLPVK